MIHITYYGHSCFKVAGDNHSVLFDPYEDGSVPGISLPKDISVDMVYCSHNHHDHNASHLVQSKNIELFSNKVITVPHDDKNGKLRGVNDIHIIEVEGKKIVHFGDIGRLLTTDELRQLTNIDIIMIPVGGYYTIDVHQAKQIINDLNPKLTILMHYRNGNIGYDVLSSLEEIKKVIPNINECPSEITMDLGTNTNIIITMDIKQ